MDDWVQVSGFTEYSVNSLGRVRRDAFNRILIPHINQTETVYVSLTEGNHQKQRSLAKIVAIAFLPPPTPPFDTPINLNGDRWDCAVDNLMWRPRWFAIRYHHQFKEPYERPIKGPLRARGEKEEFPDSFSAACRYGLLERDVVMSIIYNTYAWPTYQIFEEV